MSLASDILARAGRTPLMTTSRVSQGSNTPREMKRVFRETKTPAPTLTATVKPLMPNGVTYSERPEGVRYRAYVSIRGKATQLGQFATPERAALAHKLYMLWYKQGHSDIPNRPISRPYVRINPK